MEFTADLIANYIRTGCSLLLLFIVLVMRDRNKFITLHTLLHLGFGIGFAFFPHICYGIQLSAELDEVSDVCARLVGVSLLATSLIWFLTRGTKDGTVPITLMTSQIFSSSVTLMCQIYTHFCQKHRSAAKDTAAKNPWSDEHVTFGMVGSATMLVMNLFYLLRSHDFSSYPQHNIRVNEYLRLDAGFSMLLALTCLAFPDLVHRHFFPSVKALSPVARHLVRCTGAQIMGSSFVSLQAAGFLHEKDKKKQFITRLVSIPLLFMPFVIGAVLRQQFTLYQLEFALLTQVPLLINAVVGLFAEGTSTSKPAKKRY